MSVLKKPFPCWASKLEESNISRTGGLYCVVIMLMMGDRFRNILRSLLQMFYQ